MCTVNSNFYFPALQIHDSLLPSVLTEISCPTQQATAYSSPKLCNNQAALSAIRSACWVQVSDLYDPREAWASFLINALNAKELQKKNVNYIVRGDQVKFPSRMTHNQLSYSLSGLRGSTALLAVLHESCLACDVLCLPICQFAHAFSSAASLQDKHVSSSALQQHWCMSLPGSGEVSSS